MVRAKDGWRNYSKNVQITANVTAADSTTVTTATTTADNSTAAEAATTANSISSIFPTTAATSTNYTIATTATVSTPTTVAANNANNEDNAAAQQQQQQLDSIVPTPMMTAKKLQIMLENSDDYGEMGLGLNNATIMELNNTESSDGKNTDSSESDNNNLELSNVITSAADVAMLREQELSNCSSATSSVSNTLTNCNYKQSASADNSEMLPPPITNMRFKTTPITQQALSSALQTALNSNVPPTATANTNSNGGSSYLSSLCLTSKTPQNVSSFSSVVESNSNSGINNSYSDTDATPLDDNAGQAKIVLLCEANSHPFQQRCILLTPNIECKVGRLIAKSKAAETNAIFDCKVLSRNHAVLWFSDDGKFWVKDTKSSNGTFINENKLGNEAAELHFGDIVKFGVDVLENSRKEVHGCIIACVKLYLPDGREAISIDSSTSQRSMFSGERTISFDEMHRISLYMQELSQREKVLKSKLANLQNVLETMRKNAALNWQAYINEDQLLHRIAMLEKKLQFMDKNTTENALRNELTKLLDEKSAYQQAAKEALRKVYQDRCEALQLLSKTENSCASAETECKILREQIMSSKHALQDINTRLQMLESEYYEYREDQQMRMQEAKAEAEQNIADMSLKLQQSEQLCEELKARVSELTLKLDQQLENDEQKLQMQAVEKLDAVIADMDFGDTDEDDDEEDGGGANDNNELCELDAPTRNGRVHLNRETKKANTTNLKNALSNNSESTIMKWLQNSDLNKKEGSLDIFKAICNESDSSDENEADAGGMGAANSQALNYKKAHAKLENVQHYLQQLQQQLATSEKCVDADGSEVEQTANGLDALTLQNNYGLIKQSYAMLQDVHDELQTQLTTSKQSGILYATPTGNKVNSLNSCIKKLETQCTLKPLPEAMHEDEGEEQPEHEREQNQEEEDDGHDNSDKLHLEKQIRSFKQQVKQLNEQLDDTQRESQQTLELMQYECETYRSKMNELKLLTHALNQEKQELEQVIRENKANALKMQQEADYRNAQDIIEETIENALHKVSKDSPKSVKRVQRVAGGGGLMDDNSFEQQIHEDLAAINSTSVQREEELILYKERLEQMQLENLQLRQEMSGNQLKVVAGNNRQMLRLVNRFLPYGVAIVALFTYFIATYHH